MPTNPTPVQAVREDELRADIEWLRDLARQKRWSANRYGESTRRRSLVAGERGALMGRVRELTAEAERIDRVLAALDARVPGSRLREALDEVTGVLIALRDAVKASGKMNNMVYDSLGIAVNNAINLGLRLSAIPDSEPSGDVPLNAVDFSRQQSAAFQRNILATAESEPSGDVPAWQPIETAPKDGTYVLIAGDGGFVGEARFHEDHGWWWANNDPTEHWGSEVYPTHWMPLPAAPVPAPERETSDNERP